MASPSILKKLVIMTFFSYVLSCAKRKSARSCPNTAKSSENECAIIYDDYSCYGHGKVIEKNRTNLDLYSSTEPGPTLLIKSFVVKQNCLLKLQGRYKGMRYRKYYGQGARGEFSVIPELRHQTKTGVSLINYGNDWRPSLLCSCQEYKGCPNHRYLNPLTQNNQPLCALLYAYSTDDINTSCFGGPLEVYNGERKASFDLINDMYNNEISSIVVNEGCTLSGYDGYSFDGTKKDFNGVNSKLSNMDNSIKSYICKCDIPSLDCDPTDSWRYVSDCANEVEAKMTCTYWAIYGYTTGTTTTNEHGVTQNVELSFKYKLKDKFEFGITSNTGYNWKTSTAFSKTQYEETKYKVDYDVPPGKTYALYQVWGQCGRSSVKTKKFKVMNVDTNEVIEYKGVD